MAILHEVGGAGYWDYARWHGHLESSSCGRKLNLLFLIISNLLSKNGLGQFPGTLFHSSCVWQHEAAG
jgi:hypothetical protein